MATQQGPPSRPWFRLATMARPPAPAPQPDQPPPPATTRPPAFVRPAFTQPPPPPQPPANVVAPQPPRAAPPTSPTLPREPRPMPPSSNPRTSPLQPATSPQPPRSTAPSFTANMAPTINRAATPTSSPPKTVKPLEKTPPSSPNIKPLSRPPSPLALPSPQLKSYQAPEYDQKSVLVQETKEQPKALNNGDLRRNNPINGAPKKPEASKNHLESEDLGMTIITISGENKGAMMDLTPSVNKTHHKFGNNPNSLHMKKENPTASSDGEKSGSNSDSKSKAKNKNQKSKSPLMSTAVMNSNVQAVNNSILYNCSTTHHDPGIHLSLSRKPSGARGFFLKDHKDHTN